MQCFKTQVVFRCWGGVRGGAGGALSVYFHFICCPHHHHQRHPVNRTAPPRTISFGSQVTEVSFLWKPTQAGLLLPESGFTKEGLFQCIPWVPDSNCKATMSSAPPSSSLLINREERKHEIKAWYVGGQWMGTLWTMKGEVCWENTRHLEQAKSRGRQTVRWNLRRRPYFVSYCVSFFFFPL